MMVYGTRKAPGEMWREGMEKGMDGEDTERKGGGGGGGKKVGVF